MLLVGIIQILAGVIVAIKPGIGAYIMSAWLLLIVINLLILPGYFDIALRDLGLLLGALALRPFEPGVWKAVRPECDIRNRPLAGRLCHHASEIYRESQVALPT